MSLQQENAWAKRFFSADILIEMADPECCDKNGQ